MTRIPNDGIYFPYDIENTWVLDKGENTMAAGTTNLK